jgi:hypothetical protein
MISCLFRWHDLSFSIAHQYLQLLFIASARARYFSGLLTVFACQSSLDIDNTLVEADYNSLLIVALDSEDSHFIFRVMKAQVYC